MGHVSTTYRSGHFPYGVYRLRLHAYLFHCSLLLTANCPIVHYSFPSDSEFITATPGGYIRLIELLTAVFSIGETLSPPLPGKSDRLENSETIREHN